MIENIEKFSFEAEKLMDNVRENRPVGKQDPEDERRKKLKEAIEDIFGKIED